MNSPATQQQCHVSVIWKWFCPSDLAQEKIVGSSSILSSGSLTSNMFWHLRMRYDSRSKLWKKQEKKGCSSLLHFFFGKTTFRLSANSKAGSHQPCVMSSGLHGLLGCHWVQAGIWFACVEDGLPWDFPKGLFCKESQKGWSLSVLRWPAM